MLPFDGKCEWHGWNVNFEEQFYHREKIHHPIKLCVPQHACIL
jgi:hypothetical protein